MLIADASNRGSCFDVELTQVNVYVLVSITESEFTDARASMHYLVQVDDDSVVSFSGQQLLTDKLLSSVD